MPIQTIGPQDVPSDHGVCLVDVRTPTEFAQVHAHNAINVPLGNLQNQAPLPVDLQGPIYLICKSSVRAREAARILSQRDNTLALFVIEGGTDNWLAQGQPVIHGCTSGWSIERQARLIIGSLVVLGVIMNRWGYDSAIYLSGMVGLGLISAAISDTCAMALMLTQLPWNRRKS